MDTLPANEYLWLKKAFPRCTWTNISDVVFDLRALKSPYEILQMKSAAVVLDKGFKEITEIIREDMTEGMTGGQISPTTPPGMIASTASAGNIESAFDVVKLAEAAGASFVASGTTFHINQLNELMEKAIRKKGFSVLDAICQCPPIYGRYNRLGSAADMLRWQEGQVMEREDAEGLDEAAMNEKILTGVFVDVEKPEYCEEYDRLVARVQGKAGR